MKAAQINEYGDSSVIKINDIKVPKAGHGQVLVEVYAASLNPFDAKIRSGIMQKMIPLHFPTTLGGDIAGVVSEIGSDVTSVAVGDKVYGQSLSVAGGSGAFAEYAVTGTDKIAKMPTEIDFKQAASLPLAGVCALQGMTEHIQLISGQKILITGGTGGIGSIAIQIAKNFGAYVATTATGQGIERVKQLGADEVIDYKSTGMIDALGEYDAVFDTVGKELFEQSLHALKKGGIGVSMAGSSSQQLAEKLGVKVVAQQTSVSATMLGKLAELVEAGVVVPQIGRVFPFDAVAEAFQVLERGGVFGKVVIEIKS